MSLFRRILLPRYSPDDNSGRPGMMRASVFRRFPFPLLAAALLCLALAAACGDSDPTSTATLPLTPTPSPTPTLTPTFTPTPDPVDLAIANVSAAAGGLTADSEACLRTLYATTDMAGLPSGMGRLPSGSSEDPEDTLLVFRFLLCLTDDEWQRLLSDDDMTEFSASALRCVDEQIGIERFVETIWGDQSQMPPGETVQVLQSCGLEFFPIPSLGEGGDGAFNQVSLLWLMHDPALQGLIDCLQEAASMQELDAFFSGSSASPPAGIPQCLEQYVDILPSGG